MYINLNIRSLIIFLYTIGLKLDSEKVVKNIGIPKKKRKYFSKLKTLVELIQRKILLAKNKRKVIKLI